MSDKRDDEEKRDRIAADLKAWFSLHKRDLPWRGQGAYGVWISEIMLQQTQVITVIPYYLRFMERFATVEALASSPIDDVLKHWAGLGYYARARNLHRAAQTIVEQHSGRLPDTPERIETLPGIGRYTAGAILSIAYNLPRPILDGNVIRVLSRVYGVTGNPKSTANQKTLWTLAEKLVPTENPGDFNQAVMELGALICNPPDPKCERCPILRDCIAGNSADPSALPETPPGKKAVSVTMVSALVLNGKGEALVAQRPLHGLWGGLWEFPRVTALSHETPSEAAFRACRETVNLEIIAGEKLATVKHAVTHHKVTLHGVLGVPASPGELGTMKPLECSAFRWLSLEALDELAFAAPQVALKEALRNHFERKGKGMIQYRLEL